jgi:hypothetical protein
MDSARIDFAPKIAALITSSATPDVCFDPKRSIFYSEDDTPEGLIRKHPDGSCELIGRDKDGIRYVVRSA